MTAELVVMSTQWTKRRPQSVVTSASSPLAIVRPLIIASGLAAVPESPLRARQSTPEGLLSFTTGWAVMEIPQRRVEFGKKGSQPSLLFSGMLKTDLGMALVGPAATVGLFLAAGAACPESAENLRAASASMTQRKNEVFMGCWRILS